jgi:hypothetical protein
MWTRCQFLNSEVNSRQESKMARDYYPSAVKVATVSHRYLTRYQATLSKSKTSEQLAALAALISCLAEFLVKWPKTPISP